MCVCVCVHVTYIISPSPSSLTIARGARDGREIVRVEADAVCGSVAIVLGREIAGAERYTGRSRDLQQSTAQADVAPLASASCVK